MKISSSPILKGTLTKVGLGFVLILSTSACSYEGPEPRPTTRTAPVTTVSGDATATPARTTTTGTAKPSTGTGTATGTVTGSETGNSTTTSVALDGAALYAKSCAGCHGVLGASDVEDQTAEDIKQALTNIGTMRAIKLDDASIKAIANAFQ